jgi:hypothetical protein
MIKLLFARVLPLGLTGMFMRSSISPLKPAFKAFAAASAALSGESVQNSGADFGEVIDAAQQVGKDVTNPGLAGPATSPKTSAKDQLNDIIAQVKGQSGQDIAPKGDPGKGSSGKGGQATADASKPKSGKSNKHGPEAAPAGPEVKLTDVKGGKK